MDFHEIYRKSVEYGQEKCWLNFGSDPEHGYQSIVSAATAGLLVEWYNARLRLYWYNGQYWPTSLTRTHLLLAGNDTVPISVWRHGGMHFIEYPIVLQLRLAIHYVWVAAWLSGSALVSINEVTLRRSRLVMGWVCGQVNHLGLQPATQTNSAFYPQRDGKWTTAKVRWRSAAGE